MIYRFVQRRGLQDADAADVTQEVLRVVAAKARRLEYDPAIGSFRAWLFTVTRNTLINTQKKQARHPHGTGDTAMQQRLDAQPAPSVDEKEALGTGIPEQPAELGRRAGPRPLREHNVAGILAHRGQWGESS